MSGADFAARALAVGIRRDLAAAGAARGANLVGYRTPHAAAIDRPTADKLAEQVSVLDFGAIGNGVADDTTAIQAAIDAIAVRGGGTVFFPFTDTMSASGYYRLTKSLIVRPGVSLVGDKRRPKLKNLTVANTLGIANVFLPGNFHPDFTEEVPLYDCGTVAVGYTVTLTTAADATRFAIGDQVFTYSNAVGAAAGFEIPHYMHLNVVEAIAGATVTLRYPIDVPYPGALGRLADIVTTGRGQVLPLFFAERSTIENFDITCENSWVTDSAARSLTFRNLVVHAKQGCYGNAYQHCLFEGCSFHYWGTMAELSLCSIHTRAINCTFVHETRTALGTAVSSYFGVGLQEFGRHNRIENATIIMSSVGSDTLFNFRQCRDCFISGTVTAKGPQQIGQALYVGPTTAGGVWDNTGNAVDIDVTGTGFARYVQINGDGSNQNHDFRLRGRFRGPVSSGQAVWFNAASNVDLQSCSFEQGTIVIDGASTNNVVAGNYVQNGLGAATSLGDEATLRNNVVRANRSALTPTKDAIRRDNANVVTSASGTTSDVYTGSLGTTLSVRDDLSFVIVGDKTGTAADSSVRVYLRNVTDATDLTLGTLTLPAASTGKFTLRGNIMVANSIFSSWVGGFDGTAAVIKSVGATKPAASKSLDLRVECANASGAAISFFKIKVAVDNPYL